MTVPEIFHRHSMFLRPPVTDGFHSAIIHHVAVLLAVVMRPGISMLRDSPPRVIKAGSEEALTASPQTVFPVSLSVDFRGEFIREGRGGRFGLLHSHD